MEREQYYLDLLKPKYNILKTAGSSLGYPHSEEAKKKISEAKKNMTEETKKSINIYIVLAACIDKYTHPKRA